jgi:hypothetical protein
MKTSYGYKVLHHVEPIISLEEHLKIQDVLMELKEEVFRAITNAKYVLDLSPFSTYTKIKNCLHWRAYYRLSHLTKIKNRTYPLISRVPQQ